MKGPKELLDCEDNWVTSMGAWFGGDRVIFRGKNLFTDLFDKSWMEVLLYGITGREFNENQMRLWNSLWVLCASFPEPRIWNNRIASITGTAKSTGSLALSATTAVSEATIYGKQADYAAFEFITRANDLVKKGETLGSILDREMKAKRVIPPGFGRPMISVDERIPPVIRLAEELGFDDGAHFKLAVELDKLLVEKRKRLRLNIAGLAAALAADQGLSQREYYYYVILAFTAGNLLCYQDTMDRTAGVFFPLRCERIAYQGKPHRKWENEKNRLD